MKIILVGGCLNGTGGDTNMIKSVGNCLGISNEVYIHPFLPLTNKNISSPTENFKIINKEISIEILFHAMKNALGWFKVVYPYLQISPRGLAYYFITLYHKVLIEKENRILAPDIIHVNGHGIESLPFIEFAVANNIPLLVTSHGLGSFDKNIKLFYKTSIERDIFLKLYKYKIHVSAVSSTIRDKIISEFSIPPELIKPILNGVDVKKFNHVGLSVNSLRSKYNIDKNKKVILQVGNLTQRKNHIVILKSILNLCPEERNFLLYLIIGDGEEKSLIKDFVKINNLGSCVRLMGRVPDNVLIEMYSLSDLFILPSTSEGLALVSLEAIASGIPVITFSDLEGIKDIYNPEYMILIPDRSLDSITSILRSCLTKDWDKDKIKSKIISWDWKYVCEQYLSYYQMCIQS